MSHENVDILRRALPESAPADLEALVAILDERVEWDYVAEVESRTWQLLTFHGGRVVSCRGYATKVEALEAVGLSE